MENILKSEDLEHEALKSLVSTVESGSEPSAEQIEAIKSYFAQDNAVSKDEADFLFYLKRSFPKLIEIEAFADLFVNALTSFLLYTGQTQGALDNLEYIWLSDHFGQDQEYDELEKRLLLNIQARAESVPENFTELAKRFA